MSLKIYLRAIATASTVVIAAAVLIAASRDERASRAVLHARVSDGHSVGEVLRAAENALSIAFKVQGTSELSADPAGDRRIAVCYWLGDVPHKADEATCGIRFLMPASGDLRADPYTRGLSEALLSGRDAFLRALETNFRETCGGSRQRQEREC